MSNHDLMTECPKCVRFHSSTYECPNCAMERYVVDNEEIVKNLSYPVVMMVRDYQRMMMSAWTSSNQDGAKSDKYMKYSKMYSSFAETIAENILEEENGEFAMESADRIVDWMKRMHSDDINCQDHLKERAFGRAAELAKALGLAGGSIPGVPSDFSESEPVN
jgi:hypothetical protein